MEEKKSDATKYMIHDISAQSEEERKGKDSI